MEKINLKLILIQFYNLSIESDVKIYIWKCFSDICFSDKKYLERNPTSDYKIKYWKFDYNEGFIICALMMCCKLLKITKFETQFYHYNCSATINVGFLQMNGVFITQDDFVEKTFETHISE